MTLAAPFNFESGFIAGTGIGDVTRCSPPAERGARYPAVAQTRQLPSGPCTAACSAFATATWAYLADWVMTHDEDSSFAVWSRLAHRQIQLKSSCAHAGAEAGRRLAARAGTARAALSIDRVRSAMSRAAKGLAALKAAWALSEMPLSSPNHSTTLRAASSGVCH